MTWLSPLVEVALLQAALLVHFSSASRGFETQIWPKHLSASRHDFGVTQSPLPGGEAGGLHANESTPVFVNDAINADAYLQELRVTDHSAQPSSAVEGERRGSKSTRVKRQEKPLAYVELREGSLSNASRPQTPGAPQHNAGTDDKTAGLPKGIIFISRGQPGEDGTGTQGTDGTRPVQMVAQPTGGVPGSMKMEHFLPHLFQPFAPRPPTPTGVSGRIVMISNSSTNSSTIENERGGGGIQPPSYESVFPAPPQSVESTNIQPEGAHHKVRVEEQPPPYQPLPHPTEPENDQNHGDTREKGGKSIKAGKEAGAEKTPHQPPSSSSTGNAEDLDFPENATEQVIIAELVYKGVGTELLECIDVPATYQQMDATIDRYCGRLKRPNFKYPNNPAQTACRKQAKHVIIQMRRVLETCKQSRYKCLKELWLSTMVPGLTKLSSVMGIPQLHDPGALSKYVTNAVTSVDAPGTWKHPDLESNSCVFAHGLEETVQKQAKSKSKKASKKDKDTKANETKNMVLSLSLLLLLLQSHLVEPSMVGFLLSLLETSNCKSIMKKDPPYKVSDKLTVSTKGLFQATLANLVAEAFLVDLRECATEATAILGSRASVLCPNLIAFAKLRATLHPILNAVAQSDWEEAKRKASLFEQDFEGREVSMKDLEAMQASLKVYAVMCVSLSEFASLRHFALSSWKGSAAKWVVRQKLLSRLLQKTLGEVTASIFSDQEAAKDFALAVRSVERHSSADPEALLKYASMQVATLELDARFFCQTGLPGLGNTFSGALKVAMKSLARMKKKEDRKKARKGLSSVLSVSFLERVPPRSGERSIVSFQSKARRRDDKTFFPSSFLFSPPPKTKEYRGTATAVLGSAVGMTLKSALQQIDHSKTRTILQNSKFLKQSWWKILAKIFLRLKRGEQGLVLFTAFVWVSLFIISIPFSVLPGLGVEAIAAFCVISLVLVILELIQRQSAFHIPASKQNN
ncbi:hypothetical protein Emag_005267 [Eimeria magna]